MRKTQWACKIIHAHLIEINKLISRSLIFKKLIFLNVSICKEVKISSRCKWLNLSMLILTDKQTITQFYKNQWDIKWEIYKKCIADINIILAQRSHLFKKLIRIHNDFQNIESILTIYIRIECIELNVYLHSRNILSADSS